VNELKRLVKVHRAYEHMNAGDLAMEHGDTEAAKREYGAAESLIPENVEMVYWHAIALANAGELEASLPLFKQVFERDANWAVLTPRLVSVNLLNVNDNQLRRIVNQAP
jgi:tetratricopeptide (TPR) repeat protein